MDASITKKEINNEDAKKYEEKTIFLFEINYLVEFELYDDSNFLLGNTSIETSRSTTSSKNISLNEIDLITNDLIFNALNDFTKEIKSMLKLYISEYVN